MNRSAIGPPRSTNCCCGYCCDIAWIHDDCDPYCDCEVGN